MLSLKEFNFFSTKSVKAKIIQGNLSENQVFLYFFVIFTFDAVQYTNSSLSLAGRQPTMAELVIIWGYLFITILGLICLYIANGGKNGNDFLKKFFAFSFTVGYKYGIASFILEMLPQYFPALALESYQISVFIITNLSMVANIAYHLYKTR